MVVSGKPWLTNWWQRCVVAVVPLWGRCMWRPRLQIKAIVMVLQTLGKCEVISRGSIDLTDPSDHQASSRPA
jgi:hypothetical protein